MKKTVVMLAAMLALAACSKKDEPAEVAQQAQQADIPLAFAPAGTAFVLGNLERAPQSYVDKVTPLADSMKAAMVESLRRAREVLDAEGDAAQTARRNALLQLIEQRLQQPDTMASMGLDFNGFAAAYEIAALPVLRIQLADAARFRAFIAEVETQAGEQLPVADLNGQPYWHLPLDQAGIDAATQPRLVAAIVGEHLVLTVDPQIESTPLAALLGVERPAQSVLESGELADVNREFGYQPYGGSVVVDTQRVLALFLNQGSQPTWLNRELAAQGVEVSDVCRGEFEAIAAKAPRLVAGTTAMSASAIDIAGVLQLESALAGELQKITAPVPGLGSGRDGIEVGFSLNIGQLAAFLQAQSAAVQAQPYQCELLEPLNDAVAELSQNLASLYAVSGFVTGARASLSELDIDAQSARGTLLLASPSPMGLIGMAQGFLPELGQLGLLPDGKARQLQSPSIAPLVGDQPVWLAMSEGAIGVAIGADQQGALESAIGAAPASPAPLLYSGVDGATYVQLMGAFDEDSFVNAASSEAEEQMNYVLWPLLEKGVEFYRSIDFVSTHYLLTERGLEVTQDMRLK